MKILISLLALGLALPLYGMSVIEQAGKQPMSVIEQSSRQLLGAAKNNNYQQVRNILTQTPKDRININIGDENGDTPLIWAIRHGNMPMVRLLLIQGADATKKNHAGSSPPNIALDIVQTLPGQAQAPGEFTTRFEILKLVLNYVRSKEAPTSEVPI